VRPLALGVVLLASLALTGCFSGLFSSKQPPEQVYNLRAPAASTPLAPPAQGPAPSVRVGHPVSDPGLESTRIILVQPDHRMSFFTGARWPAPVSDMLETLAVQTLRASGQYSSVEDSVSPFPSDFLLQTTVRRFEADYDAGAVPDVYVVLDCIIGRREGRDVVATFVVSGKASASANRLGEVVAAFEQASGQALKALNEQTLSAVRTASEAQKSDKPVASSSRPSQ
jgi:cholesterol transport system auxiliary component